MSLLVVEDLSIAFPGRPEPVVKHISFAMEKGEWLALVGESGSGKSVTALSLLRLYPKESIDYPSGRILLDGQSVLGASEPVIRALRGGKAGIVFQEPMSALNPLHTIGHQIGEAIGLHRRMSRRQLGERTAELLERVGLSRLAGRLDAYPHQLSGGERQRVMIAMAIAGDPLLLIADEPTTALDVTLQAQIIALLRELRQSLGMAILLITHDLTLVRHTADRVIIMRRGEIVEQGATAEIFARPQADYTKQLLASEPSGRAAPLPADAAVVLSAEGLSVRYPKRGWRKKADTEAALHPTDFSLRRGETLGLVGESGSGKTTLGLALTRLIASEGRILLDNQDIAALPAKAMRRLRTRIQFVFQDPLSSLDPRMPIGDIVAEGLRLHRPELNAAEVAGKVASILGEVGLEASMTDRYPHEFSGGQRQRINIARAMILEPEIVVLDEPTSALDLSLQAQIISLLKGLQEKRGTSYLFITHDLRVIRSIAHRVLVLKNGRLVEQGETERIFESPQQDYTRQLIRSALLVTL